MSCIHIEIKKSFLVMKVKEHENSVLNLVFVSQIILNKGRY